MSRADRAEELFRKGYNCGQSVFAAFADVIGMSEAEAAKIASPFGAGFGKLREVCGAVSGMTLIAGYLEGYDDPKDAESKKELYRLIQNSIKLILFVRSYRKTISHIRLPFPILIFQIP